jgi:hypothetical protein
MASRTTPIAARRLAAPILTLLAAGSLSSAAAASPPSPHDGHELWATVDACRSGRTPLIGIRGSMPPDGRPQDTMYMLFRVQYLNGAKQWTDLRDGGEARFMKVGAADATRQAGRTFDLALPAKGDAFELRGVVEFQWRTGSHRGLSLTRYTTAGHHSAAGATPRGFSAATCSVSG